MEQSQSNKLALFILMFNTFITMAGIGLIIPIMPTFLAQFNAAGQVFGFIIATFAFAQFIFSPIAGKLSDQHGRKYFIIFGLVLFAISQLIFGFATEVWILYVARFLTGLGTAFVATPIMAFVADVTTYKERGKGMGMLGASISLGFMIGPGIGGFLAEVSLQFPFIVGAVVALLAAISSAIFLPNKKPVVDPNKQHVPFTKQLTQSIKAPYFVILLIVLFFSFGIANFQTTIALFVTDKFNYSATDISILLVVGGAIGVISQIFIISKLFKRFGEMKVILFSLLFAVASILALIFAKGYFVILLLTTIFSTATTLIRPAVNTLISKLADGEQGLAAGMNNAYMSVGNMVGPILAGLLFDIDLTIPFEVGGFILLFCFFIAFIWTKTKAPHLMQPEETKHASS